MEDLRFKVIERESGYPDMVVAAFACVEDAQDWADSQNANETESYYFLQE